MPASLTPIAEQTVPCKCCGGESRIFGVVDFNQNCEWRRRRVLEPCGIPIYYHRCRACGFLFTIAFDHFPQDDFLRIIYNEQYALVDPDYLDARPDNWAKTISQMFSKSKDIRVLHYGGGNGKLAQLLRADGFTSVDVYDPFVPAFATRPRGRFDLVISIEVLEHSPRPADAFVDLDQLVEPSGMILFAAVLQPPEIEEVGLGNVVKLDL